MKTFMCFSCSCEAQTQTYAVFESDYRHRRRENVKRIVLVFRPRRTPVWIHLRHGFILPVRFYFNLLRLSVGWTYSTYLLLQVRRRCELGYARKSFIRFDSEPNSNASQFCDVGWLDEDAAQRSIRARKCLPSAEATRELCGIFIL